MSDGKMDNMAIVNEEQNGVGQANTGSKKNQKQMPLIQHIQFPDKNSNEILPRVKDSILTGQQSVGWWRNQSQVNQTAHQPKLMPKLQMNK